jgi:nucleotide sugar dehydrogenase
MRGTRPDRVVVLGQGHIGLPVAMGAVEAGYDVVGFDVDHTRVGQLRRSESRVDGVGDVAVEAARSTGRFLPSHDPADLAGFAYAIIAVPTPLQDGAPDLDPVGGAADLLAPHLTPGCCVVLESTTYPGTTEELLVPRLHAGGPLRAGRDFHVGYSPQRIDPGNPTWTFRTTPKLVAGIDDASLRAATDLYRRLVNEVVPVGGTREAELAKLLENTFRQVNVALVNDLARYCHGRGIDVWSVIDAAATKPFGFLRFDPGPGVGGHCVPIDPTYLSWEVSRSAHRDFPFVQLAEVVNGSMPGHVVARAVAHLGRRGRRSRPAACCSSA